jgi:GTP cyclohydrolase I
MVDPKELQYLIKKLIEQIDPNPSREGLKETPKRVAHAWDHWVGGYDIDIEKLFTAFEDGSEGYDSMVVVGNIPVYSHCEHHLAPFHGIAHVGYVPEGRVVGLSKIVRCVDAFARRLQVQERLTVQIAEALMTHLKPLGVGVIIRAEHSCMSSRGVKIHGGLTSTAAMKGCFQDDLNTRQEFLAHVQASETNRI